MTYAASWHGATVAVKIATPCSSGRESWRAEVRALTRLHHPNVVRCMGTVVAPPTYCLVLEYCDGGDLAQLLQRQRPLGEERALEMLAALLVALAFIHALRNVG